MLDHNNRLDSDVHYYTMLHTECCAWKRYRIVHYTSLQWKGTFLIGLGNVTHDRWDGGSD